MRIAIVIVAIYSIAVLYLVTRVDRPHKNRHRLTGRGGDSEA